MRSALLALLATLALPAPARAEWSCADAIYSSELCPWFGEVADGYAAPGVGMRWSSEGYYPGSAVGHSTDGIHVIVNLPVTGQSNGAALLIEIGYEPHWLPDEARALVPVSVIVRLGEEDWRSDAPERLPLREDRPPWLAHVAQDLYRFAFGPDLVAAMLATGDAAPRSYRDLYGDAPQGVLRFEILFRDPEGGLVSSNDIIQIDSGRCEENCQPILSLAGFAEAYDGTAADGAR